MQEIAKQCDQKCSGNVNFDMGLFVGEFKRHVFSFLISDLLSFQNGLSILIC
jgi:hypothetical protein